MHRRLGSATLLQLAFPGESNPNFPWGNPSAEYSYKSFFVCFFLSNHASLFERSGLNSSRKKRTLVLVVYFLLRQKTLLNTRQGQKCHFVRDRAPVFDNRRKFSGFKFNRTRILTRNASFSFSSMVDAAQTSSKVSGMLPCKGYNLSHF